MIFFKEIELIISWLIILKFNLIGQIAI